MTQILEHLFSNLKFQTRVISVWTEFLSWVNCSQKVPGYRAYNINFSWIVRKPYFSWSDKRQDFAWNRQQTDWNVVHKLSPCYQQKSAQKVQSQEPAATRPRSNAQSVKLNTDETFSWLVSFSFFASFFSGIFFSLLASFPFWASAPATWSSAIYVFLAYQLQFTWANRSVHGLGK